MIDPQTVLIIGAGASKPYGFPVGSELRQQILYNLRNIHGNVYKVLESCGFRAEMIKQFHDDLHDAMQDTIDNFLSDRPSYRDVGAHAIVLSLVQYELHGKVFPKRDWYPHLFRLFNFKTDNLPLKGIITLNYDRSLEHYMLHTIAKSYDEGPVRSAAEKKLNSLPILHLHGSLGEYPLRPYEPTAAIEDIKEAVQYLRLTEDVNLESSDAYVRARELCGSATTLIFLGFGYHESVMERLGIMNSTSQQKIMGTTLGLSTKRRNELMEFFSGRIDLGSGHLDVNNYFGQVLLR